MGVFNWVNGIPDPKLASRKKMVLDIGLNSILAFMMTPIRFGYTQIMLRQI